MTRTRAMVAGIAVAAMAACGGERARPEASNSVTTVAAAAIDSTMGLISRGAAVAIGVDAAPAKADSILAAEGMTAESYELLMYRIASDSVMSRLFDEAVQGR